MTAEPELEVGSSKPKWYTLHTYSGYENKVKNDIERFVENGNLGHLIEEVLIPVAKTTVDVDKREKDGTTRRIQKEVEEKLFPCYVYVKMIMTNESWYVCRNTRGVTGFVGPGGKPIALTEEEIENLGVKSATKDSPYREGDRVEIKHGAMEGTDGVIEEINLGENSVVVSIEMFGRETTATVSIDDIKHLE